MQPVNVQSSGYTSTWRLTDIETMALSSSCPDVGDSPHQPRNAINFFAPKPVEDDENDSHWMMRMTCIHIVTMGGGLFGLTTFDVLPPGLMMVL